MAVLLESNPYLRDWAEFWLRIYVQPVAKPGGYENYYDNMHKHILPKLGFYRLSQLTVAVVQQFLNEEANYGNLRTKGPMSPKSIKNMRVVLDACCKRAVADGFMVGNPVPLTVYKRCPSKRVEIMNDEEQRVLEEWLFQNPSTQNSGIMLAMYTGMRLGEVCAARWKHYDFQRGKLRVEETVRRVSNYLEDAEYGERTSLVFSEAKTEASKRDLFLNEVLQDVIAMQYERFVKEFGVEPQPDDFIIFSKARGVTDPDNLSHYFGDVLKGLGLNHIKYHALRHTFASRAVENGVDVATVSGLLGHADVTTTTHYYVHPREGAMRKAMAAVKPVTQNYVRPNIRIPGKCIESAMVQEGKSDRICRRKKIRNENDDCA